MTAWRRGLLTLLWLAFAWLLAGSGRFYAATFSTPYIAFLLCGIVYLHLALRPRWGEVGWMALGGGGLALVDFGLRGWTTNPAGVASLFGFAGFVLLGLRALAEGSGPTPAARRWRYAFVGSLLFFFSDWLATTFLTVSNGLHSRLLDAYLLSFDASLRWPIAAQLRAAFTRWGGLRDLGLAFYFALAWVGAVVFAGLLRRDLGRALEAGVAFLLAGPLGVIGYNFFPAIGPAHAFPEVAPAQRSLILAPLTGRGVINAMPSLHLTWVLLAWWFARGLAWPYRLLAGLFLAFTVLATLGSGEHYLADLIVALPFALMIEAVANYRRPFGVRVGTALAGLALTAAWLATLRNATSVFWLSPAIPWAAAVATIAITVLASRRLYGASAAVFEGQDLGRGIQAKAAVGQ